MTVSLSSSSAASRTIARACYEPIGTNIQSLAASQRGVGPFAAALSMCEEVAEGACRTGSAGSLDARC